MTVENTVRSPHSRVWRRFTKEIGARYSGGDHQKPEHILARIEPWHVTLALDRTVSPTATRLFASYVSVDGFAFAVRWIGDLHNIGAVWPEIASVISLPLVVNLTTGDLDFDESFRLAANMPLRLNELTANEAIRRYLLAEPTILLKAAPLHDSERIMQLTCHVAGIVETQGRLLSLFELMGETLQHLSHIGSASDRYPLQLI